MPQIPMTKDYRDVVGVRGEKIENRSLFLDKFALPKKWWDGTEEKKAGSLSLTRAVAIGSPLENIRKKHARSFLELLLDSFDSTRLRIVYGKLESRLAINLAEGLIENAGISLDRIFGSPLIHGSAVKGVVRSAALAELNSEPDADALGRFARTFGVGKDDWKKELKKFSAERKKTPLPDELMGAVDFIPATPIEAANIVVDIVNVHTPDYYRSGQEVDLKKERPNPNYFPAVERGTVFAFPLLLNGMDNDPALLEYAEAWLKTALTVNGLGAKTAAGYGWFSIEDSPWSCHGYE